MRDNDDTPTVTVAGVHQKRITRWLAVCSDHDEASQLVKSKKEARALAASHASKHRDDVRYLERAPRTY